MTIQDDDVVIQVARFPVHALADLQRNLQHFFEVAAVGMTFTEQRKLPDLKLPQSTFALNLRQNEPRPLEDTLQEYKTWILRTAMRDSLEAVAGYLDDIRNLCALAQLFSDGQRTNGAEFAKNITRRNRWFHLQGLPNKVRELNDAYNLGWNEKLKDHILLLNGVRNCLVHRGGRVQAPDVDAQNNLTARWLAITLMADGPNGVRDLLLPADMTADETIVMRTKTTEKLFPLGSAVIFDAQELSEIIYTMFLFGKDVAEAADKFLQERGVPYATSQ